MGEIRQDVAKGSDPELDASRREIEQLEGQLGELAVDSGLAAAGMAPPPIGTAADVVSLGRSIWKGDWGGALFDVAGLVPAIGDAAKATKIADKARKLRKAINAAQAAYKALQARRTYKVTRIAANRYWDEVIAAVRNSKRARLQKKLDACSTQKCRETTIKKIKKEMDLADRAMDTGRLPSLEKGRWVHPKTGKPAAPGAGNYIPDRNKNPSLYAALKKYGKENQGVPFENGHPDFSDFVKRDAHGKPIQVEIDMKGTKGGDFSSARTKAGERYGSWSKADNEKGYSWHHEHDGVTMSLVDEKVHTASKGSDGTANSGTPHRGSDSMWGDERF